MHPYESVAPRTRKCVLCGTPTRAWCRDQHAAAVASHFHAVAALAAVTAWSTGWNYGLAGTSSASTPTESRVGGHQPHRVVGQVEDADEPAEG